MNTILLEQSEADYLISLEKQDCSEIKYDYPIIGGSLCIPLKSKDKKEDFLLDIQRGKISLLKTTLQNRGKKVFVLVRLDIGGSAHRNPDMEEIPCPHIHIYKEGFGDKWAIPIPPEIKISDNSWDVLEAFYKYCNIIDPPKFHKELFS